MTTTQLIARVLILLPLVGLVWVVKVEVVEWYRSRMGEEV